MFMAPYPPVGDLARFVRCRSRDPRGSSPIMLLLLHQYIIIIIKLLHQYMLLYI